MRARLVTLLLAATAMAPPAGADRLGEVACGSLTDELKSLEEGGVKADLDKGVDWAKSNLGADGTTRLKHYFDVKEQVLFRCPRPKPLPDPVDTAAARAPTLSPGADGSISVSADPTELLVHGKPDATKALPVKKPKVAKARKKKTAKAKPVVPGPIGRRGAH